MPVRDCSRRKAGVAPGSNRQEPRPPGSRQSKPGGCCAITRNLSAIPQESRPLRNDESGTYEKRSRHQGKITKNVSISVS